MFEHPPEPWQSRSRSRSIKGTLLGTPNREPQESSRNVTEYKDPGRYIPFIFLLYIYISLKLVLSVVVGGAGVAGGGGVVVVLLLERLAVFIFCP